MDNFDHLPIQKKIIDILIVCFYHDIGDEDPTLLSGDRRDAIFTPRELYYFTSTDTSLKVFYLDSDAIQSNSRKYNLEARLNQRGVKGEYKLRILF